MYEVSSTIIEYTWVDADTSKELTVYHHKMWNDDDIGKLKQEVADYHQVNWEELVCYGVLVPMSLSVYSQSDSLRHDDCTVVRNRCL